MPAAKKSSPKKILMNLTKTAVKHYYVLQVVPGQEAVATRNIKRLAKVLNSRRIKYIGRVITPKDKVLTVKKIPQYEVEEYEAWESKDGHPASLVVKEKKIPTGNYYQRRIVARPKEMPGYIIVQAILTPTVLEKIQERTAGVIGFLPKRPPRPKCATLEECRTPAQFEEFESYTTWKPIPLSRKELAPILQQEKDKRKKTTTVKIPWEIGQSVRVSTGAFSGNIGVVVSINPNTVPEPTVDVRLRVLGRDTDVRYTTWQIKSV